MQPVNNFEWDLLALGAPQSHCDLAATADFAAELLNLCCLEAYSQQNGI
jgi:hypothetical protein